MEIPQCLTGIRDHWYTENRKGSFWINEVGTAVFLDFIWRPCLQLLACSIRKDEIHQGFRYSTGSKHGLVMQSSVQSLCHLSSPCLQWNRIRSLHLPHYHLTSSQDCKQQKQWGQASASAGFNCRSKIQYHSLMHWKTLTTLERFIFSTAVRETVHLCVNVEDCPHYETSFHPWKEAQIAEGMVGRIVPLSAYLTSFESFNSSSCIPVVPLNAKASHKDVCTHFTQICDSSMLVSLWIRYKHCPQGAKSLGSCLINTGYTFKINIPSHPAAEFCMCLFSLQWDFKSDSEALTEAGGFWKTNLFPCCHLPCFGLLGSTRRNCAVLSKMLLIVNLCQKHK